MRPMRFHEFELIFRTISRHALYIHFRFFRECAAIVAPIWQFFPDKHVLLASKGVVGDSVRSAGQLLLLAEDTGVVGIKPDKLTHHGAPATMRNSAKL